MTSRITLELTDVGGLDSALLGPYTLELCNEQGNVVLRVRGLMLDPHTGRNRDGFEEFNLLSDSI